MPAAPQLLCRTIRVPQQVPRVTSSDLSFAREPHKVLYSCPEGSRRVWGLPEFGAFPTTSQSVPTGTHTRFLPLDSNHRHQIGCPTISQGVPQVSPILRDLGIPQPGVGWRETVAFTQ
jgi:hypothetical protein